MNVDEGYEAKRWLIQAEEEYSDAELLFREKRYYLSLFLCQQSAEKALKSYVLHFFREPVITHSIARLLGLIIKEDPDFEEVRSSRRLDDYYIQTRYPNGLPGETPATYYDNPDEVITALKRARKVIDLVKKKIGDNFT